MIDRARKIYTINFLWRTKFLSIKANYRAIYMKMWLTERTNTKT